MTTRNDRPILYREEQRFTQPWIWAVLAVPGALLLWGLFRQAVLNRPFGNNPAPTWLLGAVVAFFGLLLVLFAVLRLTVEVRESVLSVRFFPLLRKEIPLAEIAECEARAYRPIREYGGWGIKYGFKRGWAYNVRGNRGVQLRLRNGKKILVGSQRAEELAAAIRRARSG